MSGDGSLTRLQIGIRQGAFWDQMPQPHAYSLSFNWSRVGGGVLFLMPRKRSHPTEQQGREPLLCGERQAHSDASEKPDSEDGAAAGCCREALARERDPRGLGCPVMLTGTGCPQFSTAALKNQVLRAHATL